MRTSDKIEQVSASLFAVHRDLALPKKDAKGQVRGKSDYRYLSLPALIDHLRPKLKDAQLYVTQEVTGGQGFVEITTTVWHLSGQFIEFGPTFMAAGGDAQAYGSAISYGRRYSLSAVFNLQADEDDDGAKATKHSEGTTAKPAMAGGQPRGVAAPSDNGAEVIGEGGAAPGAGGGTSDPIPALSFITREQFEDYAQALGGKTELLRAARKRYGDKILSWKDITQSQADALLVQGG